MGHAEPTRQRPLSVVPSPRVRVGETAVRVGPPRAGGTVEPHVELVREGGVVRAIDVTCACGQRFRLRCVYDAEGGAGS